MKCIICGEKFKCAQFGDGTCPNCGQEYEYEEGTFPVLDNVQLDALLQIQIDRSQPEGIKIHDNNR